MVVSGRWSVAGGQWLVPGRGFRGYRVAAGSPLYSRGLPARSESRYSLAGETPFVLGLPDAFSQALHTDHRPLTTDH